MADFSLENKVALVTGGGSGIGRAIALLFAQKGAFVEILDIDEEAAAETLAALEGAGGRGGVQQCDVADWEQVRAGVERIRAAQGGVDILVNNAGVAHIGNVSDTSPEDFERVLSVNVKGVYHCLKACVEPMCERGGGVILNMASVASRVGIADRFAYSASKGAVLTMTLSVARDYVDRGIRCNCVCPARIHTPFVDGYLERYYPGNKDEMFAKLSKAQPIGRMGRPEEVAQLALFLCSDEAAFITGAAYPIDGGFMNLL